MLLHIRKTIIGLAASALAASGLALVTPTVAHADTTVPVHIFTFNDFHGRLSGTPVDPSNPPTAINTVKYPNPVAFLYTIERAALADAGNSIVVSAGDNFGASEFASAIDNDNPTVKLLNLLAAKTNFKASAVGNHEFDQGFTDLTNRINGTGGMTKTAWTYLAANVTNSSGNIPAPLQPYYIYTLSSGVKVAVVGAVTQQVPSLVSPAGVSGLTFGDPVAAVNKYATELKTSGQADIVIADYHEGAPTNSSLAAAVSASPVFDNIVNKTNSDVDAVVNGHTHFVYAWTDAAHSGRPIVQTGSYGANVGNIELTYDTAAKKVTSASVNNIATADRLGVDLSVGNMGDINDAVNTLLASANVLGQQVVGKIDAPITGAYIGGEWTTGTYQPTSSAARDDRTNESSLGTLAANSFLFAANDHNSPYFATIGGADIGIINAGGGLRAELPSSTDSTVNFGDGTVTYAGANNIMPFGNSLWTIELTGAQIKQFLEEQWQSGPSMTASSRPFVATAFSDNVTYTVNTDQPKAKPCTLADKCAWDDGHITSVFVNGLPLDPNHVYKVITLSYLIEGGDNYWVTPQGTNAKDTGLLDRDVWVSYLMAQSGMTQPNQTPTQVISPSFARPSVVVSNLMPATKPMAATVVTAGGSVTASLSRLDMTSLGSPANTTMTTYLQPLGHPETGQKLATTTVTAPGDAAGCAAAGVPSDLNPASNGCAKLAVTIPANTQPGDYVLNTVVLPSGTTVQLAITVVAAIEAPTGGTVHPPLPIMPVILLALVAVMAFGVRVVKRSSCG